MLIGSTDFNVLAFWKLPDDVTEPFGGNGDAPFGQNLGFQKTTDSQF